jgi:hypothetical protein
MKISMPKPCTENWNLMTASEKGRFCASCQTQVVNFEAMPLEEIKDFLEQETGAICGRLSRHQIQAFNAAYQELPSPSNLRTWTMAAVLTGISALPAFAQDQHVPISAPLLNTSVSYDYNQVQITKVATASDTIELTGQVVDDETGEAMIGATIVLKGTKIGVSTDIDGKFRLFVPKSKEVFTLEVHYLGYNSLYHDILPEATSATIILNLTLKMQEHVTIGVIIISKKQRRINRRTHRKALSEERKRERAIKKEQNS